MKEKIIYYIVTLMTAGSSAYIFWTIKQRAKNKGYNFGKKGFRTLKEFVKFKGDEKEYEQILKKAGIKVDIQQYQVIRYMTIFLWFFMMLAVHRFNLSGQPNMQTIMILVIFLVSTPKKQILGKKTPFTFVMEKLTEENKEKNNEEIYRAISQLKNMSRHQNDKPLGALYIFEQLRKFTSRTRPVFNRMIALYSENKKNEAIKYFENEVGTNEGTELANVLMKLDYLSPSELKTQLEVYQENVKNERMTARKKRNQQKSDIIFFMVVISLVVLLANFIIVVMYLDSLNLMKFTGF